MLPTTRAPQIHRALIPLTPEAMKMYQDNGGRSTRKAEFGYDPLMGRGDLNDSRKYLFISIGYTVKEIFCRQST